MSNQTERPDVELNALGAGCLASCGTSCLGIIVTFVFIAASGIQLARVTPDSIPGGVKFVGFLFGLASNVFVGFIVARAAKQGKMFHALMWGALSMLFGVLVFVLPSSKQVVSALAPFGWLLTLPMVLWGAKLAIDQEENR